jgi:hypothetical protein
MTTAAEGTDMTERRRRRSERKESRESAVYKSKRDK